MRQHNRLYTLEGNNSTTETLGSWLTAAFKTNQFKLPFTIPVLNQVTTVTKQIASETFIKPIQQIAKAKIIPPKIIPPKISVAPIKMSLPVAKMSLPKANFKSLTTPKNPFSKKQKVDQASSYQDFMNEIEQQQQNNYAPEPSYSPIEQQEEQSFSQADIEQEIDSTPIYGYTKNELMGISLKLGKPKLKQKAPKIGTKLTFGRKKPNLLQKLTLKKGKTKIAKVTPKELSTGLAVVGATAAIVATGGTAGIAAGIGTALGVGAGAVVGGAQILAVGAPAASMLFANGSPSVSSALNATASLLNNPTVQDKIPLAQNANTAINTGLDYYNTGSGIAETLGFKPPSLGTTSEEFFGLLSNSEKPTLDRALNIPQNKPITGGIIPFKNPVTDPSHPLYIPPTGKQGQQGQTKIPTSDRPPPTIENSSGNIGLIVGIGLLGYLFMNKKGKK